MIKDKESPSPVNEPPATIAKPLLPPIKRNQSQEVPMGKPLLPPLKSSLPARASSPQAGILPPPQVVLLPPPQGTLSPPLPAQKTLAPPPQIQKSTIPPPQINSRPPSSPAVVKPTVFLFLSYLYLETSSKL